MNGKINKRLYKELLRLRRKCKYNKYRGGIKYFL